MENYRAPFIQLFTEKDTVHMMSLAATAHAAVVTAFLFFDFAVLAAINLLSALVLLGVRMTGLVYRPAASFLILYGSTLVHVGIGSVILGWEIGLYFFLILFPIVGFLLLQPRQLIWMLATSAFSFILLYLFTAGQPSPLPAPVHGFFYLFNAGMVVSAIVRVIMLSTRVNQDRMGTIQNQADIDSLTGLLNRRALLDQVALLTEEAHVMLVDLDNFKRINDRFGHSTGDMVLKDFGRLLQQLPDDIQAARWGGEEFLLILPGQTRAETTAWFDSLLEGFQEMEASYQNCPGIQFSFTAGAADVGASFDRAVSRADELLYQAKTAGKGRLLRDGEAAEPSAQYRS
ncbi:GGDEF domain-containing protein [Alkalicoccus chagannorensis]|uniref:GGDEF domain-containing protein n=1 Tax=Alkalicoccus chagannorensis TaxID=427072 RepID=UPI00040FEFDC|nr:GGDEF domain-containing protein [Alkalicoccus chagannorensis]